MSGWVERERRWECLSSRFAERENVMEDEIGVGGRKGDVG